MTKEEINKTLVEAEGGCWHEWEWTSTALSNENAVCLKCGKLCLVIHTAYGFPDNPDFFDEKYFIRMLKIADKVGKIQTVMMRAMFRIAKKELEIDQIPALVATELARIIEEEKGK